MAAIFCHSKSKHQIWTFTGVPNLELAIEGGGPALLIGGAPAPADDDMGGGG